MSEIIKLEREIEETILAKAKKDRMERLLLNADFRELILKDFCTDECVRYVGMSISDKIDEDGRRDALGHAQAAGYLKNWIQVQCQIGNIGESKIPEMKDALAQLRAEAAAEAAETA